MSIIGSNILAGAAGASGAATGYQIERSLRFNSGDTAYLERSFSSAGNRKVWTWSGWVKKGKITNDRMVLFGGYSAQNNTDWLEFGYDDDKFYFTTHGIASYSTRVFRDLSAWHHVVVNYDGSNLKFYTNGTEALSYSITTNLGVNTAGVHRIGRSPYTTRYLDGYLAEVYFIDGQTLAPTVFGGLDNNNVWQPKSFAGLFDPYDDSEVWSSNASSTVGTPLSGKGLAQMFNGNIDNSESSYSYYESNSSASTITFSPALATTDGSNVKMYISAYQAGNGQGVQINGSSYTLTGVPGTGSLPKLFDLGVQSLSSISWTAPGGTNLRLSNPVVDGKILIDTGVTVTNNSFYLKFADNSTTTALGLDSADDGTSYNGVDFDGADDYLSLAASSDFAFGTGDFTIEMWIKTDTTSSVSRLIQHSLGSGYGHFLFYRNGNQMAFYSSTSTSTWNNVNALSMGSISVGVWTHFAVTRQSGTVKTWKNGTQVTSTTGSTNLSGNYAVFIGAKDANTNFHNGQISNLRVVKGTAVYTSNFTPSTSLTNVTNTVLLCCQSSSSTTAAAVAPGAITAGGSPSAGTFSDADWTVNNLTAESAQVHTGVAFDGTGDYLTIPNSNDFLPGSGDFTIEGYFLTSQTIAYQTILSCYGSPNHNYGYYIGMSSNGTGFYVAVFSGSSSQILINGGTYVNDGKWHHFAVSRTGTTIQVFLDGTSVVSQSNSFNITATSQFRISGYPTVGSARDWNGSLSNIRIVKGTGLYTSNFTVPTTPLANVTNTKLLCCQSDSSVTAATVSPGTITSAGNTSVATISDSTSANDSLVDTPTNYGDDTGAGNEVRGNYATLNPLEYYGATAAMSNGNLDVAITSGGGHYPAARPTINPFTAGIKSYCEVTIGSKTSSFQSVGANTKPNFMTGGSDTYVIWRSDGVLSESSGISTRTGTGVSYTTGDIIGIAYDNTTKELKFYKNNSLVVTWQFSTDLDDFNIYTGTDSSSGTGNFSWNFGQRAFVYTAPSGYKALCTQNLPEPTIADGSAYFDTVLYTGNAGSLSISDYAFSPDFVWIKQRSLTYYHRLLDTVRGIGSLLYANYSGAADSQPNSNDNFASFDSDGFTLGAGIGLNTNGAPMVAWAWDAGANSSKTYTVTVVSDSGNKYRFDGHGTSAVTLDLEEGSTYTFDQSDSSNAGHPLRFSTTSNGTHGGGSEYTTGVVTSGTPGAAGAYTKITIAASAPVLYYYCTQHSGMGGQINTNSTAGATVLSGGLNSSVYDQSQTWSNVASITTGTAYTGRGLDRLFNGIVSNADPPATGFFESNGAAITVTFSSAITATSSIKMWIASYSGYSTGELYVNGSNFDVSSVVSNNNGPVLIDLGVTSLTSFGTRGNQNIRFSGLVVDGKLLVDAGVSVTAVPSSNSVVRANPAAGFSITKYIGNDTTGAVTQTVPHGLNAVPEMYIIRSLGSGSWYVYHKELGNTKYLSLNSTAGEATSVLWNDTSPTSSVFSVRGGAANTNNQTFIAYSFSSISGYSLAGSYIGNGSADGPFVFTNMRPKFILIKRTDAANGWFILDMVRDTYNALDSYLDASSSAAEGTASNIADALSNGFKVRGGSTYYGFNASGGAYIYYAVAQNPFRTARAR